MHIALTVMGALYGAAAGLFLPRATYVFAVPQGTGHRTACPAGHLLNRLLGPPRCPSCRNSLSTDYVARIGPSTWASCMLTAAAGAALAAATGPRPELVVWLLATPFVVLLGLIDWSVHRLPDVLTLPLAAGTATLLGTAALLPGVEGTWTTALLGALALGGFYLVLFVLSPKSLRFGDVKLAVTFGLILGWHGWAVVFVGAFAGFVLGALYGGALTVFRGQDRKAQFPFGPFLASGTLLAVTMAPLI